MTLCFDEALRAKKSGLITEARYLADCLSHFAGVRHRADAVKHRPFGTSSHSPVGEAIRNDALNSSYKTLPDPVLLQEVFSAASSGDEASFRQTVVQHEYNFPRFPMPWQSLATFAAWKGRGNTFRTCIERGANMNNVYTDWALEEASKDATLLDVLYSADWQEIRTSPSALDSRALNSLFHDATELTWFLQHGANIDASSIRKIVWKSTISPSALATLIAWRNGDTSILAKSGMIQKASEHNKAELLKVLLDAGMDPNEELAALPMDRGESPTLPLRDALLGGAKDTIRLLLARGADVTLVGHDNGEKAVQMAREGGDEEIVSLLEQHLQAKSKM